MTLNGAFGINVQSGAATTAVCCDMRGNTDDGGLAQAAGTRLRLERCRLTGNGIRGLVVQEGAAATAVDCEMSGNRKSGVFTTAEGTRATLERCHLLRNGHHGLLVQKGAAGEREETPPKELEQSAAKAEKLAPKSVAEAAEVKTKVPFLLKATLRPYQHIGLDHFARKQDSLALAQNSGHLRRNFQGYTVLGDCDLLGFGASAISQIGPAVVQNETDIAAYQQAIAQGNLAWQRGFVRNEDELQRARIIEELMCHGCTEQADPQRYPDAWDKLNSLDPKQQWVQRDQAHWQIQPAGRDFLRLIAQCFDCSSPAQTSAGGAAAGQAAGIARR